MARAQRSIVIDAPIEKVFSVITRYEQYPEFLDDISKVKVTSVSGNIQEVTFWLKVIIKEIHYTLKMIETTPNQVTWSLIDGQMMKSNEGSWLLESLSGQQTKATYTVEVGLKGLVPKSISTGLIDVSLPKMMEAFKERAES